mgnify:CR=1 FL=1
MATVIELRQSERILIDAPRLETLFRQMGDRAAEGFVMDSIEDISDRLAEIEQATRNGVLNAVPQKAERVESLCADIGLVSLARVAGDLRAAAARGDMIAYRAVWERLVRIGDRSLAQVWEMPGLSL